MDISSLDFLVHFVGVVGFDLFNDNSGDFRFLGEWNELGLFAFCVVEAEVDHVVGHDLVGYEDLLVDRALVVEVPVSSRNLSPNAVLIRKSYLDLFISIVENRK